MATVCDDGNVCTADGCSATTGACIYAPVSELPCTDGNPCSLGDSCTSGSCSPGAAKVCVSAGNCQAAACDSSTGACVTVDLAGPCTGVDACVTGQTCQGGQCGGGAAVSCDDANPCTTESCNPASGLCTSALHADGAPCGFYRACAAGVCSCVLGAFGLPSASTETLASVHATAHGFIVAGQSAAPGGAKGLVAHISLTNQPFWQHRYTSSAAKALDFSAVASFGAGFQVAASLPNDAAIRLRLDAQGNLVGQDLASPAAEAQAMIVLADSAVVLSTAFWAKAASTYAVRLAPSGATLWTTAIAPSDPQDTARAHSLIAATGELLVAGHDVRFATPAISVAWVARLDASTGKLIAKQAFVPTAQGELLFAVATTGTQVLMAGEVQGGSSGPSTLLRLTAPLVGGVLPEQATAIGLGVGAGSLAGLATTGKLTVAVGWKTQPSLDPLALGLVAGKVAWMYAPSQLGQQSLSAVTVLDDGTVVAVGSRTTGSVSQGYWLRLSQDGAAVCPP